MESSVQKSRWPNGAPYALCLTHDVDHIRKHAYQYLWRMASNGRVGIHRQLKSLSRALRGDNPAWNFDRLMRMEDSFGARSTFLFLQESARGMGAKYWGRYDLRSPEMKAIVRELDAGGWDVGLHGSLFSYRDLSLLASEKALLEDILGRAVVSTRQHYLNYEPGLTLNIHEQIGLKIDSTFGSSSHAYDGRWGYQPFRPEGSRMIELPITVMDTIGLHEVEVRRAAFRAVQTTVQSSGVVVLDWHQCAFDEQEFPERVAFYRDVIAEARAQGAWIATMAEIANHWSQLEPQ